MEILIMGATGLVGRPLVQMLLDAGCNVRAVTRNAGKAAFPAAVRVVVGDPAAPESVAEALEGVDGLFLHPRAVGLAAPKLLALAKAAGVRRVVVLSATNVDEALEDQPSRYNGDRNREVEAAAIASGLKWVSLRASYFATNALRSWGTQIAAHDTIFGPYAEMAEAPIDPADLGEIAARALLTDLYSNRKLELTGPRSITNREMVETIGQVLRRPLRYVEVAPADAEKAMVQQGLDPQFVAALIRRYGTLVGKPAAVTGDAAAVLGRPPHSFAEWAMKNIRAFAPAATAAE
jgi:uncharacterized protein YbjT (DUF2867 family)